MVPGTFGLFVALKRVPGAALTLGPSGWDAAAAASRLLRQRDRRTGPRGAWDGGTPTPGTWALGAWARGTWGGGPPPSGCGVWRPELEGCGTRGPPRWGHGVRGQGLRDEGHGDVSLRVLASWHLRHRDTGFGDLPGDLMQLRQVELYSLQQMRSYTWYFGQLQHLMCHQDPHRAGRAPGCTVVVPTSPFPSRHIPEFVTSHRWPWRSCQECPKVVLFLFTPN